MAVHRTGLSERFLDPSCEVTIKIHTALDFDRIPVPANTLRVMIAKRTPLPQALKELGMTSVTSLVWACHRAGVQWPGIPSSVDNPRVMIIQRALDRLAADQARRAVKAAADAETVPGEPAPALAPIPAPAPALAPPPAPAPGVVPAPVAPAPASVPEQAEPPQEDVGAAPQVPEPVATPLPGSPSPLPETRPEATPAPVMEAEPTPRAAAPRGRPRVLPITADTLAEMAQKGISAAEVCAQLKVTAKQLVAWCYRNNMTYPGLPKGTKGVAVLQAQVDAATPVRLGGVFLPIKIVGRRIIIGKERPEGDISDVEAWCVREAVANPAAVGSLTVELQGDAGMVPGGG